MAAVTTLARFGNTRPMFEMRHPSDRLLNMKNNVPFAVRTKRLPLVSDSSILRRDLIFVAFVEHGTVHGRPS